MLQARALAAWPQPQEKALNARPTPNGLKQEAEGEPLKDAAEQRRGEALRGVAISKKRPMGTGRRLPQKENVGLAAALPSGMLNHIHPGIKHNTRKVGLGWDGERPRLPIAPVPS